MKKILVSITFCFIANLIFAQTAAPTTSASGENSKKMTVAEANALNGTSQATINGKPYSQYKAEQQLLKNKQQAAASAQPVTTGVTLGSNQDSKAVNSKQKATAMNAVTEAKPVDTKGTSLEIKTTKPSVENKTEAQGPSSTDPTPAAKKTEAKSQGGSN